MNLREIERTLEILRRRYDSRWDGGKGSGNWGHEGREGPKEGEGEVGGSVKGTGGLQNRIPVKGGGYTSKAKMIQKANVLAKTAKTPAKIKEAAALKAKAEKIQAKPMSSSKEGSIASNVVSVKSLSDKNKDRLHMEKQTPTMSNLYVTKDLSKLPKAKQLRQVQRSCSEISKALNIELSESTLPPSEIKGSADSYAERSELIFDKEESPLSAGNKVQKMLQDKGFKIAIPPTKSTQDGEEVVTLTVIGNDGYTSTIMVQGPTENSKDGSFNYKIQYGQDGGFDAPTEDKNFQPKSKEELEKQKEEEEPKEEKKQEAKPVEEKSWQDLPESKWTNQVKKNCSEIADALDIWESEGTVDPNATYAKEPGAYGEKSVMNSEKKVSALVMGKHIEKKLQEAGFSIKNTSRKGWNTNNKELVGITVVGKDGYTSTIYVEGPIGTDGDKYSYKVQYGASEYLEQE